MADIILSHEMPRTKNAYSIDDTNQIYNALDSALTFEVWKSLNEEPRSENQEKIYDLSRALQAGAIECSLRGIRVNEAARTKHLTRIARETARLENTFRKLCIGCFEREFKWSSPKQMLELFYGDSYLNQAPIKKRNADGKYTPVTDEDALQKVAFINHWARPFARIVLALRGRKKLAERLQEGLMPGKRWGFSLNVCGTNSGRMSSQANDFKEGSNVQNLASGIKDIFVADEGYVFLEYDLEQADSRNFGANCYVHLGPEYGYDFAGTYLDACESGDLHTTVAKMCFKELPWGTESDRSIADRIFYREYSYRHVSKQAGHGTNYFGQPPAIAEQTQVPQQLIEVFQPVYFESFPCIQPFQQWTIAQVNNVGVLINLFGRERAFYGRPFDKNVQNEAIAFMGQSCTAEQANIAFRDIWRSDIVARGDMQILLQQHDSILCQVREDHIIEGVETISRLATVTIPLAQGTPHERSFTVPIEIKYGWNWGYFNHKKPKENPDGMTKWKGELSRTRQSWPGDGLFRTQVGRRRWTKTRTS